MVLATNNIGDILVAQLLDVVGHHASFILLIGIYFSTALSICIIPECKHSFVVCKYCCVGTSSIYADYL